MGIIDIALFFGSIFIISYRKEEWLNISKKSWLAIGYAMFSTAFLFFTGEALSSGEISFQLFDIPFISLNFTREDNPVIFYLGVIGIFLVGVIGWISIIEELIGKK